MADRSSLGISLTPWIALLVSGVAVLSVGVLNPGSSRPSSSPAPVAFSGTGNTTFSRLWQDPFSASSELSSERIGEESYHPIFSFGTMRDDFWRTCCEKSDRRNKLLVIPVVTPAGYLSSAVEARRRQRVAVTHALLDANFAPRDADRLNIVFQGVSQDGQFEEYGTGSAASVALPYEWWDGGSEPTAQEVPEGGEKPDNVLVIWIQEDPRFNHLRFIDSLLRGLVGATGSDEDWSENDRHDRIGVAIVGPSSSDGLIRWGNSISDVLTDQASNTPAVTNTAEDFDQRLLDVFRAEVNRIESESGGASDCLRGELFKAYKQGAFLEELYKGSGRYQYGPPLDPARKKCNTQLQNESSAAEPRDSGRKFEVAYNNWIEALQGDEYSEYRKKIHRIRLDSAMSMRFDEKRRSAAGDQVARAILLQANEYLDYGLYASREQIIGAVDCLRSTVNPSAIARWRRGQDVKENEPRIDCLNEHFGDISDSDQAWRKEETVVHVPAPVSALFLTGSRPMKVSPLNRSRVLSPRATSDQAVLQFRNSVDILASGQDDGKIQLQFTSFVATDKRTVRALFSELDQRFSLCGEGKLVAIIYEAETNYGQHIGSLRSPSDESATCDLSIIPISYLRGLDGERVQDGIISGSLPKPDTETGQKKEPIKRNDVYPHGAVQADTAYRIAQYLAQRDKKFGDEIVAVGVFATDLWDKEVMFRAIRSELETPVLFTTDYDAYYTHRSTSPWSQNLLVASPLSLLHVADSVDEKHDVLSPLERFRGGYQAATYNATRFALNPQFEHRPPEPEVFEIGRQIAFSYASPNIDKHLTSFGNWAWTYVVCLLPVWIMLAYSAHRIWILSHRGHQGETSTLSKAETGAYAISLVFCLLTAVAFVLLFWLERWNGTGEPWMLGAGISLWPTVLLRGAAIALSVSFIVIGLARIRYSNIRVEERFGLAFPYVLTLHPKNLTNCADYVGFDKLKGWQFLRQVFKHNALNRKRATAVENQEFDGGPDHAANRFCDKTKHWFYCLRLLDRRPIAPEVQANRVWLTHRFLIDERAAVGYMLMYMVLTSLVVAILFWLLDYHGYVARGEIVAWADSSIRIVTVLATLALIFFISRHTLHCEKLMKALRVMRFVWPDDAVNGVKKRLNIGSETANRVLDLMFIGERTQLVSQLIVLPFLVIFILILSRNPWFDGLGWSPGLTIVLVVFSAYLVSRTYMLRRSSELARQRIIRRLREQLVRAENETDDASSTSSGQLKEIIDYCIDYKRGALVPWFRHPILQALALPFAGLGAIVLEALAY